MDFHDGTAIRLNATVSGDAREKFIRRTRDRRARGLNIHIPRDRRENVVSSAAGSFFKLRQCDPCSGL